MGCFEIWGDGLGMIGGSPKTACVSLGRNELYLYIVRFISRSDQPMDVGG